MNRKSASTQIRSLNLLLENKDLRIMFEKSATKGVMSWLKRNKLFFSLVYL